MRLRIIYGLIICLICSSYLSCSQQKNDGSSISMTLIPPTTITNKVDLDIRVGLTNNEDVAKLAQVNIYINNEEESNLLYQTKVNLDADERYTVKHMIPTHDKVGENKIIAVVDCDGKVERLSKTIEVIDSDIRSTRLIDGAWVGLYHWSETEGKHWNQDIKEMTDDQWKELVRSMHKVGMDIIVLQELFRNEYYVGKHDLTVETYKGKAFYPSALYPERMPIKAKDPVEAILSEADKLGMHVFMGVGMFAWFDFTAESLKWHKLIAEELWNMYGHHSSFYGFYVSEESGGSLDNWEQEEEKQKMRKQEIVHFFQEFKDHCRILSPSKPVMLATNSMSVPQGADTYPDLLKNLDILCPFGFARMPEGDITGKEAADMLQKLCDEAGSHLWFDLEAFLFNPDQSLYPRPIEEIIHDLTLFDNFEKILCYQFPGVFNDSTMSRRIGEERTIKLYNDYQNYQQNVKNERNNKDK